MNHPFRLSQFQLFVTDRVLPIIPPQILVSQLGFSCWISNEILSKKKKKQKSNCRASLAVSSRTPPAFFVNISAHPPPCRQGLITQKGYLRFAIPNFGNLNESLNTEKKVLSTSPHAASSGYRAVMVASAFERKGRSFLAYVTLPLRRIHPTQFPPASWEHQLYGNCSIAKWPADLDSDFVGDNLGRHIWQLPCPPTLFRIFCDCYWNTSVFSFTFHAVSRVSFLQYASALVSPYANGQTP